MFNKLFTNNINNLAELKDLLYSSLKNKVINNEVFSFIESVLDMQSQKVRDIMIPRHQIDYIDINDSTEAIIEKIIATGHSRFPVVEQGISNVIGVFHIKDMIHFMSKGEEFKLKDNIRTAFFVPEIKNLYGLLHELRIRHVHLAIVTDEFTNIIGMVTLEMIVEQLVGNIEDEYDYNPEDNDIVDLGNNSYRVKGACKLNEFVAKTNIDWQDNHVETLGGFIIKFLERLPINGEILQIGDCNIEIINADQRRIKTLLIKAKTTTTA